MAKAVFFNVPASGHVNPSLPLIAELVKRGEQITVYLTEGYRSRVEATGAAFVPYPNMTDNYFEQRGLDGSNPPHTARRLMELSIEMLDLYVEPLRAEGIDYVIYDAMCPWGNLIGQVLGVSRISSMALLFLKASDLSRRQTFRILRRGLPHLLPFARARSAIRRQWKDVKPPSLTQTLIAPADLTISYTSAEFQPNSAAFGDQVRYVGPSIAPRTDTTNFPFDRLSDKPLIYVSLGTVINDNPDFFRACLDAFRDQPYQLVLSIGERVRLQELGAIPMNAIVRPFVPQLDVLQRAALFITHAGLNSVHEGLYYGVPLIVVPQQVEQQYTANRIVQLGAGVKLDNATPTADQLHSAVERVLNDLAFKGAAERLGAGLKAAGGQVRGAEEIIGWVKGQ